VPLYFLRKLWEEFHLGHHVKKFDISEFQGVGHGSMQNRKNARCELLSGPHPPR
jgi:hypothetical protein